MTDELTITDFNSELYEKDVVIIGTDKAVEICSFLGLDPNRINRIVIDASDMSLSIIKIKDKYYRPK